VIDYITTHMETDFAELTVRKHVERVKGHGREESYCQMLCSGFVI